MDLESVVNGEKVKSKEEVKSTLRFDIKLDNPTDLTSNEVHYPDLINEKTRKGTNDTLDPLDGDENAELAAIAKRLEERYGPTKKSSKRAKEQDLIDLGDGYDLNDPFVDDAEVYEDVVPHQVDTLLGGFYINVGDLEYKKVEGMEDLPLKRKKPSFKKQTSTPKTLLASKKVKLAKQQIATSAQRSESMKKKLSSLSKSNPKALFMKAQKTDKDKITVNLNSEGSTASQVSSTGDQKELETKILGALPTLPTDIPPTIEAKVKEIESMVKKADGKLTIKARYAYDSILLEIESECKEVKMKTRIAIFDYLAYVMGITRGSLMNRIKRTIKKMKGNDNAESSLQQLKEAIDEVMPSYVAKYEVDMAEYEAALKAEQESSKMEVNTPGGEDFQSPLVKTDGAVKLKKPRKTFKWSPMLKSLLCDVVRQKVEAELANKNRTASGEEVIMDFLQTTIKPLWPNGWFMKRTLYNITQPVHCELTGYHQQKKGPAKKDKAQDIRSEDGSVSLLLPSPSSSSAKPLPPYEGSTQASFGSIVECVPDLKKSVITPAMSTMSAISPKDSKTFDEVFQSSSSVVVPTTVASTIAGIKVNSSKQTLLPSKHFQANVQSSSTGVGVVGANKGKTPFNVLPKIVSTNAKSQSPTTVPNIPALISTIPAPIGAVPTPIMAASAAKMTPAPVKAQGKVVKSPLNTVAQKGPTKVTKITTPPNLNLSKQEIDAIIRSIQQTSVPHQQLQVLLQHTTTLKGSTATQGLSRKNSSSSLSNLTQPPHVPKPTSPASKKPRLGSPSSNKPTSTSKQSLQATTTGPKNLPLVSSSQTTAPVWTTSQVSPSVLVPAGVPHLPQQEAVKRKSVPPPASPAATAAATFPVVGSVPNVTMGTHPSLLSQASSRTQMLSSFSLPSGASGMPVITESQLSSRGSGALPIKNLVETNKGASTPAKSTDIGRNSVESILSSKTANTQVLQAGSHSSGSGTHALQTGSHSGVSGAAHTNAALQTGSYSSGSVAHTIAALQTGSHSSGSGAHTIAALQTDSHLGAHTVAIIPNQVTFPMFFSSPVSTEHNYAPRIPVYVTTGSGVAHVNTPPFSKTSPAKFNQGHAYERKD